MSRVAVVVPLKADAHEGAQALIEKGPPFDAGATSFEGHHVFLTEREAVFLFEGPEVRAAVEQLVAEPPVWAAALAWRACLSGRPRIAKEIYSWVKPGAQEGVAFEPTPGPGDSEGGDLYAP